MSMGGGGGGPSQTTTQTSNIPEYARPYVENMLGATQAQLFNTNRPQTGTDDQGNPTYGPTEITGFKPYQPYSTDVNNYFAGPSTMQQQSYQGMANMGVAPQIGEGSQLAGTAGIGSLGLGSQAAMAGQNYANMATNPNSVSAYMSPYMQNVVDYQKGQALRDYGMAMPKIQAQAVGQGAFGGNRMALQQAEAGRGLMSQLQGIEAQGAQSAFDKATQAQQYGANLGLQGLQTGLQGYGQALNAGTALGQLGQTQYGQQMGILQGQNQFGAQQQQLEQNKINQAISDYATQQQYPMLQLGLMSNMLRGLPMQSQTTQMYQAQPSMLQQGIGTVGSLASLYGAGKKEGGVVGYKYGGAIPEPKLAGMAQKLSPEQLQARLKDSELDSGERQIFADALADKSKEKARYEGIAAAGGGLFESQGYAGGGILAFSGEDESLVPNPEESVGQTSSPGYGRTVSSFGDVLGMLGTEHEWQKADRLKRHGVVYEPPEGYDKRGVPIKKQTAPSQKELDDFDAAAARYVADQKTNASPSAVPSSGSVGSKAAGTPSGGVGTGPSSTLGGILAGIRKEGPQGQLGEDYIKTLEERLSGADKRLNRSDKLAMAKAFAEFGTTAAPGGIGQAISRGLGTYAEGYGKALESDEKYRDEITKQKADILSLRRAEERGDVKLATELQDKIADRANRIQTAQIAANATMAGHGATQKAQDLAIDRIMKEKGVGYTDALQIYKRAGLNVENTDLLKIAKADAALAGDTNYLRYSLSKKPEDQQKAAEIKAQKYRDYGVDLGNSGGQNAPQVGTNPDAGGIVDVPGKGKFQQLPNGNYIKIG